MPDDAPNILKSPYDPHEAGAQRWIARRVSFTHPPGRTGPRLVGIVEQARFCGRTERGQIPDYRLTIRGQSGRLIETSLVESYASFD